MRVMLFCGKGTSSDIVFTHLKEHYNLAGLVTENPPSRKRLLKNRIKRLGMFTVMSQLLFIKLVVPFIKFTSKNRLAEVLSTLQPKNLDTFDNKLSVSSINDDNVSDYLGEKQPEVIVVNGTRIIGKKLLSYINVPIINIHAGITPKYRGVHGGYWALVKKDIKNCGVTVHHVDRGIDTGNVICQRNICPTKKDSFVTYPFLQLKEGLICLDKALNKIKEKDLSVMDTSDIESTLFYHPTIWQYLYNRIVKGIK